MAILNQKRILNLIPKTSAPVTIHVSQGDVGTEIEFTLVKGDELFVNTGSLSASVHGVREDGANFGVFTCTLSGSSVKFPLHAEMTAVKGTAIAEIVLVDSQGNKVGSSNFGIMVEESVFPLGVTYDNDVSVYESILAYVQTIPAQVESDITAAVAQEAATRAAADAAFTSALSTTNSNIASEVSARESAVENEKSARIISDVNLQSQIDQLIAPSGEAPSAAEVQNARIGIDGIAYDSLGNAIRGQNNAISGLSRNIFNDRYLGLIDGWSGSNHAYSGTASKIAQAYSHDVANYPISFESNTQYTLSLKAKTDANGGSSGTGIVVRMYYTDNTLDRLNLPNDTTSYKEFLMTSASGKTIASLNFEYGSQGSNKWYLSDVQIEKGIHKTSFCGYISAIDSVARLQSNENANLINNVNDITKVGGELLNSLSFAQGAWEAGSLVNSTIRIRTILPVKKGDLINIVPNDLYYYIYEAESVSSSTYYRRVTWNNNPIEYRTQIDGVIIIMLATANTYDASQPIKPIDYDEHHVQVRKYDNYIGRELVTKIPSYWDSEIATSISTIRGHQREIGSHIAEFFFITDIHWEDNTRFSPYILDKLCEKTDIDMVVFGGDAFNGEYASKALAFEKLEDFHDSFDKEHFIMVSTFGNHDYNAPNTSDKLLSDNELYYLFNKKMEKIGITTTRGNVNYIDNLSQKVRFITFTKMTELTDEVYNKVASLVNELDNTWKVVLFSHIYWASPDGTIEADSQLGAEKLATLKANSSATIICWIVGHTHTDKDAIVNGLQIISTTCDSYKQAQIAYGAPTMTAFTNTEQALDCVQIDLDNENIYFTRIGAGSDREFTF